MCFHAAVVQIYVSLCFRYGPGEGRYAMVAEACARLSSICTPLADIIRDCCVPSPTSRPASSAILPRLEAIVLSPEGATPLLSAPVTGGGELAGGVSAFPSLSIITAMEKLGLTEAMTRIGDEVLSLDVITKPALVSLLTSAGVSVPGKAQLLKCLIDPAFLEVCESMEQWPYT